MHDAAKNRSKESVIRFLPGFAESYLPKSAFSNPVLSPLLASAKSRYSVTKAGPLAPVVCLPSSVICRSLRRKHGFDLLRIITGIIVNYQRRRDFKSRAGAFDAFDEY